MSSHSVETEPRLESVAGQGVTWINIERPTPRELDYLGQIYPFHHLDLEDCLSKRQLPKIDEYPDYLFILLHFPRYSKEVRYSLSSQVAIFLGRNYLVTVHTGELKPLARMFQSVREEEGARQELLSRDAGYLFHRVLDTLVDYCFPILSKVLDNLDSLADKVYDPRIDAAAEIALLRRDIAAQRRIVWELRGVVLGLDQKIRRFTQEDLSAYFGDVSDHINRVWSTLEECREMIEIYKDQDFVLTQDSLQRVMTILTILIGVMIPFTVISGIYGMNIPLPLGVDRGSPLGFLLLLALMALGSAGVLFYLRRHRWI